MEVLPSGELTVCNGKSPCLMGKSTIFIAIFHCFLYVHQRVMGTIVQAMFDYRRVYHHDDPIKSQYFCWRNPYEIPLNPCSSELNPDKNLWNPQDIPILPSPSYIPMKSPSLSFTPLFSKSHPWSSAARPLPQRHLQRVHNSLRRYWKDFNIF